MKFFLQTDKQVGRFALLWMILIATLAFNISNSPTAMGHPSQLELFDLVGPHSITQGAPTVVIGNLDDSAMAVVAGRTITLPVSLQSIPDSVKVGTMTVDIEYDNSVLQPISCPEETGGQGSFELCNLEFSSNTIRLIGTYPAGLSGERQISILVLEAIGAGGINTDLTVEVKKITDDNGNNLAYLAQDQEIAIIKQGDGNCDGRISLLDALAVLQLTVRLVERSDQCQSPQTEPPTIYFPGCDANGDGTCSLLDALGVLLCTVGIANDLCPAGSVFENQMVEGIQGSAEPEDAAILEEATTLYLDLPTITAGDTFTATLIADAAPRLSAAEVSIGYDTEQFRIVDCQAVQKAGSTRAGMCNADYQAGLALFGIAMHNLAISDGEPSAMNLAQITFEHIGDTVIPSTFELEVSTFVDRESHPVAVTVEDGVVGEESIAGNQWIYLPIIER